MTYLGRVGGLGQVASCSPASPWVAGSGRRPPGLLTRVRMRQMGRGQMTSTRVRPIDADVLLQACVSFFVVCLSFPLFSGGSFCKCVVCLIHVDVVLMFDACNKKKFKRHRSPTSQEYPSAVSPPHAREPEPERGSFFFSRNATVNIVHFIVAICKPPYQKKNPLLS